MLADALLDSPTYDEIRQRVKDDLRQLERTSDLVEHILSFCKPGPDELHARLMMERFEYLIDILRGADNRGGKLPSNALLPGFLAAHEGFVDLAEAQLEERSRIMQASLRALCVPTKEAPRQLPLLLVQAATTRVQFLLNAETENLRFARLLASGCVATHLSWLNERGARADLSRSFGRRDQDLPELPALSRPTDSAPATLPVGGGGDGATASEPTAAQRKAAKLARHDSKKSQPPRPSTSSAGRDVTHSSHPQLFSTLAATAAATTTSATGRSRTASLPAAATRKLPKLDTFGELLAYMGQRGWAWARTSGDHQQLTRQDAPTLTVPRVKEHTDKLDARARALARKFILRHVPE